MKRKYTRWTKELLEPVAKSSNSYAECLRKMGLREVGGNYKNLIRNLDKFGIDTGHMLHQAHNKGKEFVPFEGLKKTEHIKKRVLLERGCQWRRTDNCLLYGRGT